MSTDRIRVYWNVHKKRYSVQKKIGGRWKVVEHRHSLLLKNVTTKVNPAGIVKIREDHRKRVVAWLEGDLATIDDILAVERANTEGPVVITRQKIWFDPYCCDEFQRNFDIAQATTFQFCTQGYLELRQDPRRDGSVSPCIWWVTS